MKRDRNQKAVALSAAARLCVRRRMWNRSVTRAWKASVAIWLAAFGASARGPRVLTLEEALRVARERQPQIREPRYLTEAAYARADQARSGLLPQVSATAGYQKATGNSIARPGSVAGDASTRSTGSSLSFFNFFHGSLSVNQLLWDFGQSYRR